MIGSNVCQSDGKTQPLHLFPSENHLQLVENGGFSRIVQSHDDNLVLWRHPGGKGSVRAKLNHHRPECPTRFPRNEMSVSREPGDLCSLYHFCSPAPLPNKNPTGQVSFPPTPDPRHPRRSWTVEMIAEPRLPRSTFPEKRLSERSGALRACQEKGSRERAAIAGNPRPFLARRTEARRALRPGVHRSAPLARSGRGGVMGGNRGDGGA